MSEPIAHGARTPAASSEKSSRRGLATRIVLGGIAVVAILAIARSAGAYVPVFAEWVASLGMLGPIVFIAGYALAVVAFVPGALLTLAGGAVFGLAKGIVYVFIAAVLGSAAAFLLARHVARSSVEERLASNPRFAAIDRAVAEQGLKIMFLLRLSPIFPFNFLNYGLGVTNVRFRDYLLASFGMIPGTILYVYYGWVVGDVAALAGGGIAEKTAADYAVQAIGLLATLVVTLLVTRVARRALAESTSKAA